MTESNEQQLREQLQLLKPGFYEKFPMEQYGVGLGLGRDATGRDPCIQLFLPTDREVRPDDLHRMMAVLSPLPVQTLPGFDAKAL
ncbi:MAG: hypothetical protein SH850_28285 [Planctomycetaceae bacterium]|nr:hypothetical protein [Planctomycetaceae bacterium]